MREGSVTWFHHISEIPWLMKMISGHVHTRTHTVLTCTRLKVAGIDLYVPPDQYQQIFTRQAPLLAPRFPLPLFSLMTQMQY